MKDKIEKLKQELSSIINAANSLGSEGWCKDWSRIRDDQCRTVCFAPSGGDNRDDPWKRTGEFISDSRSKLPKLAAILLSLVDALYDRHLAGCPFSDRQLQMAVEVWEDAKKPA